MTNRDELQRPHVVIIGGGFGGLYAARALRRAPVEITLVDRRNHHLFQPLLYQVASAALNPGDIAAPIRGILGMQKNVRVLLGEVTKVDPPARRIRIDDQDVSYDFLVVATGATHSYFGHDDWERFAPGLKSVEDALEIRRRILLAFEAAEREPDERIRAHWLTFAVIGGGPTGVELAGAIAELSRYTVARDFRLIDPRKAQVILVEALPRILSGYSERLSASAASQLLARGVDVRTGTTVTNVDADGVDCSTGRIDAKTTLWAAGVSASPLVRDLGCPVDRAGRAIVETDLTIQGHRDVFVIGDAASVRTESGIVPGLAPAAIQEGRHAAQNIRRQLEGKPHLPFRYRDKGSMATIGRAAAIAQIGRIELTGLIAWLAWALVHVMSIIGFRNRVLVLIEWVWAYVTYERGARLITGSVGLRSSDPGRNGQ